MNIAQKSVWLLGLVTMPLCAQIQNFVPDMGEGDSARPVQGRRSSPSRSSAEVFTPERTQESAKLHTQLAYMYYELGNNQVALEELMVAMAFDKKYAYAYAVRGVIYSSLGQMDKAGEDFKRAINLEPNNPEINDQYGNFLCTNGKSQEAFRYFKVALDDPLYATPGSVNLNAGVCSVRMGKDDQAVDYFLKAINTTSPYAEYANVKMAEMLYRQKNLSEARIYLEEAMRNMEPPTPDALWLGICLERKEGQKVAENSYVTRLRKNYPNSTQYKKYLKGEFE